MLKAHEQNAANLCFTPVWCIALCMVGWWRDLSVTKKLYITVGIMAALVAGELVTLLFTMNTLTSVRAFVAGEGLWSKAQKNAVHSLYQFALSGQQRHLVDFDDYLKITEGDRMARIELEKEEIDFEKVRAGLLIGGNDPNDIDGMISFFVRFKETKHIHNAVAAWARADQLLNELRLVAKDLNRTLTPAANKNLISQRAKNSLDQIDRINKQLTEAEVLFSSSLGAGSRQLEKILFLMLALTVLTIGSVGIFMTYRFSRNLRNSLKEIIVTADNVAKRNFSLLAPVRSNDELGLLALAMNKMSRALKESLANTKQADEELRKAKEQFRLQQKLQSSESKLHQVIEAAPNGLLMVDQNRNIVLCNAKVESLFGYKREELLGKPIEFLFPKRFHPLRSEFSAEFFGAPEIRIAGSDRDFIGLRKDATEFPIEIGLSPVRTDDGDFVLASVIDITERQRIASDLVAIKEEAEAANLAKSAFLANMSHEIRTPLGAMMGFADLVIDPKVRPSEKVNFVAAIRRNGELLSSIINDILDLSKIEAGKMQIETRDIALSDILTDTKTLLGLQAKEKGVTLKIVIDENVPEVIKTDPLRLRQVLINIIGNAIKFTTKGSVEVSIHLQSTEHSRAQLVFVVHDTGRGISEDQIGKLFAPFSQVESTSKRKYGGTGLGLVLSKRFANLLGGDVVLSNSIFGKGSTFKITIDPGPIRSIYFDHERSKITETEFTGGSLPLEGINILLAEDSLDNQLVVSHFLSLAGATVDIACNGQEAIQKAKHKQYHVLLMDLQMPIMDGFEATAKLRQDGYDGMIVALTAHTLSDDRERCLQSGFDDHIGKPVNRRALIERVDFFSKQVGTD